MRNAVVARLLRCSSSVTRQPEFSRFTYKTVKPSRLGVGDAFPVTCLSGRRLGCAIAPGYAVTAMYARVGISDTPSFSLNVPRIHVGTRQSS
ncbi:hypothetical protein SKAU_G00187120 [Synaphobranchus kaupii]|uniref:Uncharacterized protein n=1 Tax=Synaphobranchus kaupii TaxID=118154 RepID=A0A9Q1FDB7_SYNKA|nr:hypothetical protein SKAU_G00187120 [Synaphobranchus kaupii]